MSAHPKISVVTPSFNQAGYLELTLKSVLDQGYPNLEYVVIDGGSTDGSVEIIERYAERLTYWESEPDRGHAHALNKGFACTTGEIMCWINSDDLHMPWSLSTVAEVFEQLGDAEWITGLQGYFDERGRLLWARQRFKNVYDFLLGNYEWIQQASVFWRRSLWERAGSRLNEDYQLMVDGELWCRFFLEAELHHVECVLAGYRQHGENRAAKFRRDCHAEMRRAIERLSQDCSEEVRAHASALSRVARLKRRVPALPTSLLRRHGPLASSFEAAKYRHAVYEQGRWVPRPASFYCG